MRRGATLLELSLALILVGSVLAIALPRFHEMADRLAVGQAARDIVAAHSRTRMAAVLQSRMLELTIGADDLVMRPRGDTTQLWHASGPAANGVALVGPPRTLTFSPVGITFGLSNASFRLTRGSASRTVVVSRLGRVRLVP